MPLPIAASAPSLIIRRDAYERTGLTRQQVDERLGLTDEEFRVEGDVVVLGPVFEDLGPLIEELEQVGLVYFEDFFELPGGWPGWVQLLVAPARA